MRRRLLDDLRIVVPSWVAARLLVAIAFVLAGAIANRWFAGATTPELSVGPLAWDGAFYRDIATSGYGGLPPDAYRFFPLFPAVARAVAIAFGGNVGLALLVVSGVASLTAGVLVRRLVLFERDDAALAARAVWLTNLFPASFVLVWGYAEALFLALALGSFLSGRRGRFAVAAGCAFAAGLTRPVALALAAPLAIEAWRSWRNLPRRSLAAAASRLAAVAAPVAGVASYLLYVGQAFGDPWRPLSAQSALRGVSDPISRLALGVGDLVGDQRFGDGLHIPFAIIFIALLVVVFRRWPVSYGVFAALLLLVALSADNLNSIERYALNAFPLLFALADVTRTERRERLALAVCGNGLVALCALAWLSVYVP